MVAVLDLIAKKKKLTQIIKIGSDKPFQIDVTPSITHNMISSITSNPIEDGSKVSDHITLENRKLTIEGFISNSPLNIQQNLDPFINKIITTGIASEVLPSGLAGSLVALFDSSDNRIQAGFEILEQLYQDKQTFSIQTGLKLYDNMVITSLSIPRNQENSLRFNMELEQINFVQSQTVLIPPENVADNVKNTATDKQSEGKKDTKTVSDEINNASKSILIKARGTVNTSIDNLLNYVRGLF